MKHIFLVHSHITYILSRSVIDQLSINQCDIIFISTRGYTVKDYYCINLNKEHEDLNNTNYLNAFTKWKYIKEVDKKIGFFEEEYQVYLPHIAHPLFQILSSNRRCQKVNILEEGVNCLSYRLYNYTKSFKRRIISVLFNKSGFYGLNRYFRVHSNIDFKYFQLKQTPTFFGLTVDSFKYVNGYSKQVVSITEKIILQNSCKIPENANILLLESIVEQKDLNESTFFTSIESVASSINCTELYIKFHPYQSLSNKKKILKILNQKFKVIILSETCIMELVFLNSKNLRVFGFTSSLLYYAKLFRHEVQSFSSLWVEDSLFKSYRKSNDFNFEQVLNFGEPVI